MACLVLAVRFLSSCFGIAGLCLSMFLLHDQGCVGAHQGWLAVEKERGMLGGIKLGSGR